MHISLMAVKIAQLPASTNTTTSLAILRCKYDFVSKKMQHAWAILKTDACGTTIIYWLTQQTDNGAQVLIIASIILRCAAIRNGCEHFSCCSAHISAYLPQRKLHGLVQVDGGQWHGYWGVDRLWQVAGSPRGRHGDPPLPAAD